MTLTPGVSERAVTQTTLASTPDLIQIRGMSLNLTDDEIHGLIAYARDKFEGERYPFAPALRPIRGALAKLDPNPIPRLCQAYC